MSDVTLDQLAEQAVARIEDEAFRNVAWETAFDADVTRLIIGEVFAPTEAATQALREQLARTEFDVQRLQGDQAAAVDEVERLREQLAQATREVDAFLAPVIVAPPKWWLSCRANGHTVSLLEKSEMADEYFCGDCSRGQSSRKAKRARDENRGDATVLRAYIREVGETPAMTASNREHWKARAEVAESALTAQREDLERWRAWVQFVWLDGGPAEGSNDDLRRRACERHDLRCTPTKSAP